MLFIPAEAIFAEIHAHYGDLIDFAQQKRVWLVSPTTMMAILTTARAVLKDAATRQQVHIIQEHLVGLGKDFDRFQNAWTIWQNIFLRRIRMLSLCINHLKN